MTSKVRAVLFDLDDTLLNTTAALEKTAQALADALRRHANVTATSSIDHMWEIMEEYGTGYPYLPEELCGKLSIPEKKQSMFLSDLYLAIERGGKDFPDLLPGVRKVLQVLRNGRIRMGVVTNGNGLRQVLKMQRHNILRYFESISISETVHKQKPDPGIFRPALEDLRTKPNETVYVGDKPMIDMVGAKKAGLTTILVKTGRHSRNLSANVAEADFVINALPEMLRLPLFADLRMVAMMREHARPTVT